MPEAKQTAMRSGTTKPVGASLCEESGIAVLLCAVLALEDRGRL